MLHRDSLSLRTPGRCVVSVTAEVARVVASSAIEQGLCHVFLHHTSASLLLMENADPDVLRDLEAWLERAVPDGDPLFVHTAEGPDDMPAHVRSALLTSSLTIPVERGRLDLGSWQGVFLYEHRRAPHARRLTVTVTGS